MLYNNPSCVEHILLGLMLTLSRGYCDYKTYRGFFYLESCCHELSICFFLCFCLGVSVGLGRLACFSWWIVILDNTLVNDCSLHLSYCVTQMLLKLDLFIINLL